MATLAARAPRTPDQAAIGDGPSILDAIRLPAVNLAIWRRHLSAPLGDATRAILSAGIDDIRFTASPDAVSETVLQRLAIAGHTTADHVLLAADIAVLAHLQAGIMQVPLVEVRLERVTTNACYKFHADYVRARLITTYCGRGTEWIDADDAARHASGAPAESLDIRRLETGDVALFKGRIWAPDSAIVHRSPPIGGTGAARLVLVINPGMRDGDAS